MRSERARPQRPQKYAAGIKELSTILLRFLSFALVDFERGACRLNRLETGEPGQQREEKVVTLFEFCGAVAKLARCSQMLVCRQENGGAASTRAGVYGAKKSAERLSDLCKGRISVSKIHGQ